MEAMNQGGFVAWSIFGVLVIMSVGSFYILITKWLEQQKIINQYKDVRSNFWRANSLEDGARKLEQDSAWRQIVDDSIKARDEHNKMSDSLEAHDWMHGSLARSEERINRKLAGGLPFLASVGATAPFIGLLGTVIGIYRALINIGIEGSASIDKVAGPVGEALIMTAIGLLVAVPAVLAYNWLASRNKRIAGLLSGFSTDILANINSKGAVRPATMATTTTGKAPTPTTAKAGTPTTTAAAKRGIRPPPPAATPSGSMGVKNPPTGTGTTTVRK